MQEGLTSQSVSHTAGLSAASDRMFLTRAFEASEADVSMSVRRVMEGYEQMVAVAGRVGLVARDAGGDGNCFYYSVATLLGLAPRADSQMSVEDHARAMRDVAGGMRQELADALPQFWDEMGPQLVIMYADDLASDPDEADRIVEWLFAMPDGGREEVLSGLDRQIRTMDSYANAGGDLAPVLAARVYGLVLNVVEAAGLAVHRFGEDGGIELHLVRHDGVMHWMPARPARPGVWDPVQARAILAAPVEAEGRQEGVRRLPAPPPVQPQSGERLVQE
ncbi:OTU domain-containing protein, partial [Actinacidiphila sp. bgisy167]|uniref:OTU domain-containing protein n=1 Tax=Actinacidiphila sp. bgisy167 TaxID=3413797 RepID=UPI003D70A0F2